MEDGNREDGNRDDVRERERGKRMEGRQIGRVREKERRDLKKITSVHIYRFHLMK